ncbi:MAG: AAA family ATPase, partial [Acidimicrobiales bacterium]
MRISGFHVDGFGALADFGVDDLSPGLVIVNGPNEAGKSTLLDFLTAMLFGFPARRDNPRFRPPVRGGRHGGQLT